MDPLIISVVSVVSIFVLLPGIIVTGVLGNRRLRGREKELAVRERELALELEELSYRKVVEARAAIDRAGELGPPVDAP
ncbi:MAG: hypothetical protein WCL50_03970 [Spirochaetota bacterium]